MDNGSGGGFRGPAWLGDPEFPVFGRRLYRVAALLMTFLLTAFGFLRNSWIGKMTIIAVGVLLTVLMVFAAGGRSQRAKQKIANLENYVDVQKRVDRTTEEAARLAGAMSDDDLDDSLRRHTGAFRE